MAKTTMRILCLCGMLLCILFAAVPAAGADGKDIRPGYHFLFGTMEQDYFNVNGEEPIVWRVLDTNEKDGTVLAVSEFGLYTTPYHRNNKKTDWGDTDVRDWLNTVFLAGFTPEERNQIVETWVSGSLDAFFLLDAEQVSEYLKPPYLCYATPWALVHDEPGAYVNEDTGASSWLVRTDTAKERIAWVGGAGKLYTPYGKKGVNYLTSDDNVVRPAMWIRKEACGNEADEYGFPPYAFTKDGIATRSGPTTAYTSIGSYYKGGGELVRMLSKVNDGSIWWVEIEFEYNGLLVRCYTGHKRVDIPLSRIPDDTARKIGTGKVAADTAAYYGPGTYYKQMPEELTPPAGTTGIILKEENGWYCLEYDFDGKKIKDREKQKIARVWLPADALVLE